MRIHRICPRTRAEGPGKRFCIWVQGCSLRCPGCFNPQTWDATGGEERSVQSLLDMIARTDGIEGVTLLGGEPFDQPDELARLLAGVAAMGLSVMVFTGYTLEQLRAREPGSTARCLQSIDLLADGPFQKEHASQKRPWVGSDNQRFHFLTGRYTMEDVRAGKNRLEVHILPGGGIAINGMADADRLEDMQRVFAMRRAACGGTAESAPAEDNGRDESCEHERK